MQYRLPCQGRSRATKQPAFRSGKGCAVYQSPKYATCDVCGLQVDAAVPKSFCTFCSISPGAGCPWVKPVAVCTAIGFFSVHIAGPAFNHEKDKLVPTDLPYESKHIEQSSMESTAISSGWGHLAIPYQVSTSTALPPGAGSFLEVSQWPRMSNLSSDSSTASTPLPLRSTRYDG